MRKRTLIAIIVTVAALILTNHYWLIFRPMPVDFDIKGKGKCGIEVQLNKKDNDKFVKAKSQCIDLNLDEQAHADFRVKRSRFPKRIQIIITGAENNSPIEIKNISLKNGKYKLDDLTRFSANSGKLLVKDDTLVIYPENNTAILLYNKTLSARTAIKFDFKLLIIIAVLTFLLACKLSNYVAEFKTVKDKSRIEIVFLTIFFVFLFIPMSHINQDEISKKENRTLAKWKPLISHDGEINYNFGNDFNEWFNDRFNLKNKIIPSYLQFKYLFSGDYAEIPLGYVYKKSGWMFYNQSQSDMHDTFTSLSQEQLNNYTQNINKLLNYCKEQNIKLYIVISPTKEYLYREYDFVHTDTVEEKTKALVDNVRKNLGYDIIYPVEQLKKAKEKEYVCYKTDHHLTDDGAFAVYNVLMQKIKQDFKDIKITDETEFDISYNNLTRWDGNRKYKEGCNYERSGLHDKNLLKTKYKYYDYKKHNSIKITGHHPYYQHINNNGNYKVFLICNSFGENLSYFLDTSFKEIRKYRFNSKLDFPKRSRPLDISGYMPIIEEQNPDILLLVLSTGYVDRLNDLYNKEDN